MTPDKDERILAYEPIPRPPVAEAVVDLSDDPLHDREIADAVLAAEKENVLRGPERLDTPGEGFPPGSWGGKPR
jgi:hypothetical protein